jgi:hypothetical protein
MPHHRHVVDRYGTTAAAGLAFASPASADDFPTHWSWEAINGGGRIFQLRNVATQLCLDVNGWANNRTRAVVRARRRPERLTL